MANGLFARSSCSRSKTERYDSILMMPYWDQRGTVEVHGKYFKKDVYHGLRGLVKDGMIDVTRLEKELTRSIDNGFVGQHIRHTEYRLTPAGRDLQRVIDLFGEWGACWAFGEPRPNELDPIVLLWWMRRRVSLDRIHGRRIVIEFNFCRRPQQNYWLLIEPEDVSVCLKHPGFDIDLVVTADLAAFYRVWLGHETLSEALRRNRSV